MATVLVTGGAGFIGSFLVDRLMDKGERVVIFDSLDEQVHHGRTPPWLHPEAEFVRGDVRDIEALARVVTRADAVVHLAAAVGVGQSQYQVKHYVDVNTGGTANLMDILANRSHSVGKVVVAASMSSYGEGLARCEPLGVFKPPLRRQEALNRGDFHVYGPSGEGPAEAVPTHEGTPRVCTSVYALTKMDQEELVLMLGKAYGIPSVALRFFNVYGPRQSLSNPYTGVSAIFMSRIKNGKPPVVYEDGLQSRTFVSVRDVVQAIELALTRKEADYESFNVGTREQVSIRQVAETLIRIYGAKLVPQITGQFRKGDVRHCFSDIGKIESRLGFQPRVSFETGMRELVAWADSAEAQDFFEDAQAELKRRGLA